MIKGIDYSTNVIIFIFTCILVLIFISWSVLTSNNMEWTTVSVKVVWKYYSLIMTGITVKTVIVMMSMIIIDIHESNDDFQTDYGNGSYSFYYKAFSY